MSALLEIKDLKKYFPVLKGIFRRKVGDVKAVDGISFTLLEGEIVGLVGESGSGKSTAGRTAIRLLEPTSGTIRFQGEDLLSYSKKELRKVRTQMQMVFQDPLASLNPRKNILENIGEALLYHQIVKNRSSQIEHVASILKQVGMSADVMEQYPHQFSGGQQQRISIGRAIAMQPRLIICDEAISALDLSIQAQILNLLYDLKQSLKLSYLFISHDLSVVKGFCNRVLVMYRGKIVESGPADQVFNDPKHPYTQLLISSIPKPFPSQKARKLPQVSTLSNERAECPYFSRCPISKPDCKHQIPPLKKNGAHTWVCIH